VQEQITLMHKSMDNNTLSHTSTCTLYLGYMGEVSYPSHKQCGSSKYFVPQMYATTKVWPTTVSNFVSYAIIKLLATWESTWYDASRCTCTYLHVSDNQRQECDRLACAWWHLQHTVTLQTDAGNRSWSTKA